MPDIQDIRREAEVLSTHAEERIRELEAERAALQAQIVELRPYVRRNGHKPATTVKTSKKKADSKVSEETLHTAAVAIYSFSRAAFSRTDLADATQLGAGTVSRAINELRAREVIRPSEKRQLIPSGHATQFYRVMDEAALDRLIEQERD